LKLYLLTPIEASGNTADGEEYMQWGCTVLCSLKNTVLTLIHV